MSKAKGDKREREARHILEDAGYVVETPNYTRFQNTDYFNLFDMMAFHPGRKPLFVQVKSNRAQGIKQFVEDCATLVPHENVLVQFWVCYDNEGWRVIEIKPDGYSTLYDEREGLCNMGDGVIEFLLETY
jgi:Holliday junction resolvase